MAKRFSIEKLTQHHDLASFDCGDVALNRFLLRYALTAQLSQASQTYLGLADGAVVGFYSLSVGQVVYEGAPSRLTKGLAQHPVPLMLLARLAVSRNCKGRVWGQGMGAGLLKDALRRTLQAADIAGIRAFAVHAKGDEARSFYKHFNFVPSPTDPYHLFLLLKDIKRMMKKEEDGR